MPKDAEKLSNELLFSYKHVAKEDKKEFKKSDEFSTVIKNFSIRLKPKENVWLLPKRCLLRQVIKNLI